MGALKINYEIVNAYTLPGMMKDVEIRFKPRLTPENMAWILQVVSEEADISEEDIKSKSRKTEIVEARHIFCALAKKYTNASLKRVATFVNLKDHSSTLHSIEYYKEKMDVVVNFRELARRIELRIV